MAAYNEITGDKIQTGVNSDDYRDNYDKIFGRKEKVERTSEEKMQAAIKAKKGIRPSAVLELNDMVSPGSDAGQQICNEFNIPN